MKQEDKELLLKDLCARLPYGLMFQSCHSEGGIEGKGTFDFEIGDDVTLSKLKQLCELNNNKPYLRPISSMTEEEKHDLLVTVVGNEGVEYFQVLPDGTIDNTDEATQDLNKFNIHWINFDKDTVTLYLNWLNEHYFDYHGLIEKGLAIAVTEENNPYNK